MHHLPIPARGIAMLFAACLLATTARPAAAADLTVEMNELDTLDGIHAAAVGQGGEPGAFHALAKRFLAKGTAADFERLTADKVPLTRAMGAYCLARAKAPRAVPLLKAMAADPWPVDIQSGCAGGRTTVGQFAGHLLRNRNYLEFEPLEPLAPAVEGFAADVVRLADDAPIPDNRDGSDRAGTADVCRYLLDKRFVALDVGSSRVDLQACKLEYSIVSPK